MLTLRIRSKEHLQMSVSSAFPKLSLQRPVTMVMGIIAFSLIGAIAYFQIPMQLFPSGYNPPFLFVRIVFPNSTPKETEDQIVRPAEEMFATIEGIQRLRTWARASSGSFWMRFNSEIPMTTIYNQVRDRLERLMPTLPEGVERYYIWKWNPEAQPIMSFAIAMPRAGKDTHHILDQNLFSKLRRMSGVSKVDVTGLTETQVYIIVDREKARSHRLSMYQIIRKLRQDNFALPSGQIKEGGRLFYLRSHNRLQSLKELRNYPVAVGVKLGEVASVRYAVNPEPNIYRINGQTSFFVEVHKESEANTVDLCRKLRKMLGKDFQANPALRPYQVLTLDDQGKQIESAINQLQQAAVWGGFFALLILGLFLRHWRMTMLVTLAIPMSLLITLGSLYFIGETLNLLTLMGLMLSTGMVVDNAIVVVENIARLRQDGTSAYESALHGTSEVALAILMSTSTTIVVFLPLMLMSGSRALRFYMGKLGTPVMIALCASLLVALLFTPLGSSRLLSQKPPKPWPLFEKFIAFYRALLRWVLLHRFDAVLLTFLLLFSMRYPLKHMKKTYQNSRMSNGFSLRFSFPQNYPFADRKKYVRRVEKLLDKKREAWGLRHYTTRMRRYSSRARIRVYPQTGGGTKIKMDRRSLIRKLQPLLPRAPGVVRKIGWRSMDSNDSSTITMHLYGPDSFTLEKVATRLEQHLQRYPAFKQAEAEIDEDSMPELRLQLQRRWAFRYQMPANIVGGNVSYALSGRKLRNMRIGEQDVPVVVYMRSRSGQSLHRLQQMPLYTFKQPQPVPLEQMTRSKFAKGPRVVNRVNRKTYLKLQIAVTQKNTALLYKQLDGIMAQFPMPEGYTWDKGFQFRDMQNSDSSQSFALILSIVFVLILMGILFESVLLPFSVLLSIPLAFFGVYWMLYLTDTASDMMSGIGIVMLVGLVVNHAIVLVDRINQLRQEGLPRQQAILDATGQRLRPILMTTLTTICGLLPMAFGQGSFIGISYAPLGRTVIGGLTASALLSLLVVPLFYTFFDDLRGHLQRLARWILPKRPERHPDDIAQQHARAESTSSHR